MFADLVSVDGFGVDIEIACNTGAKAGRIEYGTRANYSFGWETGEFHCVISENIHGIGNNQEDAVEAAIHDLINHAFEDVDVFG